jgi:monovalent cation/hydrogen antiporter
MRGIVSLAAALALQGYPGFPRAHLVQFLAFSVILTTLVFQGLTLPPLIRFLGIGDDGIPAREEAEARLMISEIVFTKLTELRQDRKFPSSALDTIEAFYRDRALSLSDELAEELGWSSRRNHVLSVRRLRRLAIAAQRRALVGMRRDGQIGDDVMHKIERELDLEEARQKS